MAKTTRVRMDNYGAAFGVNRSRSGRYGSDVLLGNILMNEVQLTSLYVHNGMARRIVDTVAEEMTRAGFTIENLDDKLETKVVAKLEELNVNKHLNTALKWARAFGGGVIILGVNDGNALDQPLDKEKVTDVEFIRVYDRYEVIVKEKYKDSAKKEYGTAELYQVTSKESMNGSYYVHASRVIIVDGESLPNSIRTGNEGWGASSLQQCLTDLIRLDKSRKFANLALERMQQAIHKIPNLSETLEAPGGEESVTKRVDIVDRVRGILNTVVIDAAEDFDVKNNALSGVSDLLDRDSEAVSAVTGIPMFVLYGRSIGGLNSTGEANRDAWNAQVGAMQNDKLRNPVDLIVSLVIRSQNKNANDGGDYKITFNPLSVPSKKDQAEIDYKDAQTRKADMETAKGYVELNSLDPFELRKHIADKELYDIDAKPLPEPEDLEEKPQGNLDA